MPHFDANAVLSAALEEQALQDFPILTRIVVQNEKGVHARPAAKIARIAANAEGDIYLFKQGNKANAREIMDILALYCPCGTEIVIAASKPSDKQIVHALVALIDKHFEE